MTVAADALAPSGSRLVERALASPVLLFSGAMLAIIVLVSLFAPYLAPHDPYAQDLGRRLLPPFWQDGAVPEYPLGTDGFGRDYLSRLLYGGRASLLVGVLTVFLSGAIGTTLGLAGGYFGGRVDAIVMFVVQTRLAMPIILVALAAVTVAGASLTTVALVLGLLLWDRFATVTRAATQGERERDYVSAARALGCSDSHILFRQILPNIAGAAIVVGTLEMAVAILLEASLSFLGLGVQPPEPAWGLMVSEAKDYLLFTPHLIALPGSAIFLLVVAINLFGDSLRDLIGPESRR